MLSLTQVLYLDVCDEQGNRIGALNNVAMNKSSGKCLLSLGDGIYTAKRIRLRKNKIVATDLKSTELDCEPLAGKSVYDVNGKYKGTLRNVTFGKTLTAINFICDSDEQFTRGRIRGLADVIIVKSPKAKKSIVKTAKTTPADLATGDNTTETLPTKVEIVNLHTKQTVEENKYPLPELTPIVTVLTSATNRAMARYPAKRRYGDFSFLLGKIADKNITNFFGEVMIRSGEAVTLDILRQAKISGKLIELCLHVK